MRKNPHVAYAFGPSDEDVAKSIGADIAADPEIPNWLAARISEDLRLAIGDVQKAARVGT